MKGNPFFLYGVFFPLFVRRIMVDLKCASGRRGRKEKGRRKTRMWSLFLCLT